MAGNRGNDRLLKAMTGSWHAVMIIVAESVIERRAGRRRECQAGTGNEGLKAGRKDCSS